MRRFASLLVCIALGTTAGCSSASNEDVAALESANTAGAGSSTAQPAQLTHSPEFVLEKVLEAKRLASDDRHAMPQIKFESTTSLDEFRDAVEPKWGFRPEMFSNAYVADKNVIYLIDDAQYYERLRRCIDDSLAHELTHFVQAKYQGWDLAAQDDSTESDAVHVQSGFRENHCPPAAPRQPTRS